MASYSSKGQVRKCVNLQQRKNILASFRSLIHADIIINKL